MKKVIKAAQGKWQYDLKCGEALRQAIDDGEHVEIIKLLDKAYRELVDAGIIDEDDYERYTEDFELYLYDDFEDWDDPDGTVDYELSNFYDLCDDIGVWIPF